MVWDGFVSENFDEINNKKTYKELLLRVKNDKLDFYDRETMYSSNQHKIQFIESSLSYRYNEGDDIDFEVIKEEMRSMMFEKFKEHIEENERQYIKSNKLFNNLFKEEIRKEKINKLL